MVNSGIWNDKTLILVGKLIINIKNSSIPNDFDFKLYERKINGEIGTVVYKGALFMLDNGCISWLCNTSLDNKGKHMRLYHSLNDCNY